MAFPEAGFNAIFGLGLYDQSTLALVRQGYNRQDPGKCWKMVDHGQYLVSHRAIFPKHKRLP
jgi:hypothetical protein